MALSVVLIFCLKDKKIIEIDNLKYISKLIIICSLCTIPLLKIIA